MADKSELSAFLRLFADRHQTFVRSKSSTTWRKTSQWHYLTDEELISSLHAGSSLRRAFGSLEKTSFVIIQVDGTKSATAFQTVKSLQKQLKDICLQPKSFYIEELDLWQIFLFFCEPVASQKATSLVKSWLDKNCFAVDNDATSILPTGAPLQIPLQASFTWLNDELGPIVAAAEMSFQNTVSMFMQDLRSNATDFEKFEAALNQTSPDSPVELSVATDETFDFSPQDDSVMTREDASSMSFSPDCPGCPDNQDNELLTSVWASGAEQIEISESIGPVKTDETIEPLTANMANVPDIEEAVSTPDIGQNSTDSPECDQAVQTVLTDYEIAETEEVIHTQDGEVPSEKPPDSFDEPDFSLFSEALIALAITEIAETKSPAVVETSNSEATATIPESSQIQTLLFAPEDTHERAPPAEHPVMSASRKSSARDGPKEKKKIPKPAQNSDSDWDSFEQLTLPFGQNTS